MIKHIWSIVSKESTINVDNNLLSIRDVLETLNIKVEKVNDKEKKKVNTNEKPKFNIPMEYEITSYYFRDNIETEEKADIEIIFCSPIGEVITRNTRSIEFPKKMKRVRARAKVQGIAVQESGDYHFLVNLKQENDTEFRNVADIPLEINLSFE